MENLKKVLSCSPDIAIITDYDFNILWSNRECEIFNHCSDNNCAEFFKSQKMPLSSGKYNVLYSELCFEFKVTNCPDCCNGIYIIETDGNDIILSALKNKYVEQIITNQSAALTTAIHGMTTKLSCLNEHIKNHEAVTEEELKECVDILYGNRCKVSRIVHIMNEYLRYSNKSILNEEKGKVNLTAIMQDFVEKSYKPLKNKITIKSNIEPDLFICADPERVVTMLPFLVALVNEKNPENNIISVEAKRIGDFVSISVSADRCGIDDVKRKFSEHIDYYDEIECNHDWQIVKNFCRSFDGILYKSTDNNRDSLKTYSIKLPYYADSDVNAPEKTYNAQKYWKIYDVIYSNMIFI